MGRVQSRWDLHVVHRTKQRHRHNANRGRRRLLGILLGPTRQNDSPRGRRTTSFEKRGVRDWVHGGAETGEVATHFWEEKKRGRADRRGRFVFLLAYPIQTPRPSPRGRGDHGALPITTVYGPNGPKSELKGVETWVMCTKRDIFLGIQGGNLLNSCSKYA